MVDKYRGAYLAVDLRAQLGKDNLSAVDVFNVARSIPNLTTLLYPLGDNISGMCITHPRFSLIAINSGQSYGRQRFTLAHELYHLYYDVENSTSICPKDTSKFDDTERTADTFASNFLLPYHALQLELKGRGILDGPSLPEGDALLHCILEIEHKYEISRKALLVRLSEEGLISHQQKEALSKDVKTNARRLGYSLALYEPSLGSSAKKTDGEYLDLIQLLYSNEIISESRAEELLSDGFRDDISIISLEDGDTLD